MIDQLTDRLTELAKAAAARLAVFAVIGLVILIGVGFLLAAAFMAVAAKFGAIAAAVAFGTGLVVLALVALAIMMQRDPGEGIEQPEANADPKATRSDDDVLFDLLVHSATTGYATGQGDKSRMQTGFDQMITDLNALGVFDRKPSAPQSDQNEQPTEDAERGPDDGPDEDTKKAGS
ncbi:hypothetical protein ACQ0MK_08645 [Thalassospira lucentensis]|uniref:hypothetical protein n=1 Tax=Thalassospira lucentensis TaxID=168935 RepID=UPI003D2ED235